MHYIVRVNKYNILLEKELFSPGVIITPFTHQNILIVNDLSPVFIAGYFG
jgi:hypothetical protein